MKLCSLFRVLLCASLGLLCSAAALGLTPATTVSAHSATLPFDGPQSTVTIIVLDTSGSMQTNDPNGLRCSAADAYIDMSAPPSSTAPSNLIGVIDLDNSNGARGGAHNFQLAQQWTDNPVDTSTLDQRNTLKALIANKSRNCQPDGSTPTYDALNQALQMLQQSALPKEVPGSVILLTDGVPDPDTGDQINAIDRDLLPQFKAHSWPIDTIALGSDGPVPDNNTPFHTFHDFLSGIANATAGKFYDDANGVITGQPSAFNITPFFVDIFARRNHRTVHDDIGLTQIMRKYDFSVTNYTDNLDAVVVKDPGVTVALLDANGNPVTQQPPAVQISQNDPHYEIFSIQKPPPGTWTLAVSGSGQFLMKSLNLSNITLANTHVSQAGLTASQNSALALGQTIQISTQLTSQGTPVVDTNFVVQGTISYNGPQAVKTDLTFHNDPNNPGMYIGNVTIPENEPAGSYDIQISAFSNGSMQNAVNTATYSVRIEHFPVPVLFSTQTRQPVPGDVEARAVQWDGGLQLAYSPPGFLQWLGGWPLQGLPAGRVAVIEGQVQLSGQPYTGASIQATAARAGSKDSAPVQIVDEGGGRFRLLVPITTAGSYTITFHTSGSFADSHGDFGTTVRTATITVTPATTLEEIRAWLITLLYLCCLFFLVNTVRFGLMPYPFGGWVRSEAGDVVGQYQFRRARRGFLQGFLHRNLLYSRQAAMPRGLLFRFRHGGGIEVRPDGPAGANWQRADGGNLSPLFQEARELRYRPRDEDDGEEEPATFLIKSRLGDTKTTRLDDEDDGLFQAPRGKRGQRGWSDDGFSGRQTKKRQNSRKKNVRRDDDFDNW